MSRLSKTISVDFEMSANDVARFFCSMNGEEQAQFFNHVAELVDSWDYGFCFQLQSILNSQKLNAGGLFIMKEIGDYGNAGIPKP